MRLTGATFRQADHWKWALLLLPFFCTLCQGAMAGSNTTTLTEAEARILVYVSPAGQRARAGGLDIAMERQTSPKLNQADYYYFWVYDAARRQSAGSLTIGYYAVNKHTGELWDTDDEKEISNKLVRGVQAIIRRAHQIGKTTMEEYGGKKF